MAEFWDVYNKKGKKRNKVIKKGHPLKHGEYHLVCEGWIRCAQNEYVIQKRSPMKKIFGNKWYCSMGGSVLAREHPRDGLIREAMEELGIDISDATIRLKRIIVEDYTIFYIYLIDKKINIKDLVLQEEEVIDAKIVSKEEICSMKDSGEFGWLDYYDKFFESIEKIPFKG